MRAPLQGLSNTEHPSFFNIQMGVGLHGTQLALRTTPVDGYAGWSLPVRQGQSTMLGAEAAYFFTPHIGVGGTVRVQASSIKDVGWKSLYEPSGTHELGVIPSVQQTWGKQGIQALQAYDPYFTDISLDAGVYGHWPLTDRLAVGGKLLVGTRFNDGFTYRAIGGTPAVGSGELPILDAEEVMTDRPGTTTSAYDFLCVEGNRSFNWVAGVSATYYYKDNLAWKVFADIDGTSSRYTGRLSLLSDEQVQQAQSTEQVQQAAVLHNIPLEPVRRSFPIVTVGASINITF